VRDDSQTNLEVFRLDNGDEIRLEVIEPNSEEYRRVSKSDVPSSYAEAIDKIRPAADQLLGVLKGLQSQPRSVEVEFGVKLTGSLGAIIATAAGEGNFKIKLVWNRAKDEE
jgi:hypothetical protein